MFQFKSDSKANYERFIKRVYKSKVVWGLLSEEGWAICPSNNFEDTAVFPFWSDEAYAKYHCMEAWEAYRPEPIDLDSFIDIWLKGMHEDGDALVGPNWNSKLVGLEVEPLEIGKLLVGNDDE